jgi:hypothetical protein
MHTIGYSTYDVIPYTIFYTIQLELMLSSTLNELLRLESQDKTKSAASRAPVH